MLRSECYMTFSEALDDYMSARGDLEIFGEGSNRERTKEVLQICKDHMDALTGPPELRFITAGQASRLQQQDAHGKWVLVREVTYSQAREEDS